MCGIAGFALNSSQAPSNPSHVLTVMADAIRHRGPDDHGHMETATGSGRFRIGLAHQRLAIIDLSAGHQPLGNEDGRVQIVFNGEIYNFAELRLELEQYGHRFATQSDTEVIVHAYEQWGTSCVERLRGMFAFALWDGIKERLFLARDRFGKKPLFLMEHQDGLLFASEVAGILAYPGVRAEVNLDQLPAYLAYRYVPAPNTLYRGIRKLLPGSYAVWESGHISEHRYYTPPDHSPLLQAEVPADPVGAFLEKLDEAVRIRMVADVPFGAFLSGGLDSSAIVALMARHSGDLPVKTFSIGFAESAYSELDHARVIARRFGTEHHELTVSQKHLMDHLPTIIRFNGAPAAEPSDIPLYILSLEAAKTVKMVLSGEGADEFIGGYPKHLVEGQLGIYHRLPLPLRRQIQRGVSALPYRFHRIKTALSSMAIADDAERYCRWFGALSITELQGLLDSNIPAIDHTAPQFARAAGNSPLRKALYFDQTSWLPDNLLQRGDRMTMAASIEARMPFMDHELAAFVSSLPDRYRIRGRVTKWILREAMKRLLPASILDRPKVGFKVPVAEWFRGPMRAYLIDHLCDRDSHTRAYYQPQTLQRILNEHFEGKQNHEKLLWTMLTLEIWHRENKLSA